MSIWHPSELFLDGLIWFNNAELWESNMGCCFLYSSSNLKQPYWRVWSNVEKSTRVHKSVPGFNHYAPFIHYLFFYLYHRIYVFLPFSHFVFRYKTILLETSLKCIDTFLKVDGHSLYKIIVGKPLHCRRIKGTLVAHICRKNLLPLHNKFTMVYVRFI